jgi:hypothetical protein
MADVNPYQPSNRAAEIVVPQNNRSCLGIAVALTGALLSAAFLSNLTFGVFEVPDNLPLVGNLDEVLVSAILFSCLSYLGINIIPTARPRRPEARLVDKREEQRVVE